MGRGNTPDRRRYRDGAAAVARHREGTALAATLVGLTGDEAIGRTKDCGFESEVSAAGSRRYAAMAAVWRPNCITLVLDEHGNVVRAYCG
jgi:hypothetical protein